MTSKFLNISTDANLGGNSPSDMTVPSQKAVKTHCDTKLPTNAQGLILPNFDAMPVLATYEYDVSDTNWKQLFTRTNTETAQIDLQDVVYCRITVTGTNISSKYDCAFYWKGQLAPFQALVNSYPGNGTQDYCGIRYGGVIYPKNLNNGYPWIYEIQTINATARHFKIEVFKTNSKITWMTASTNTTRNGTYHNINTFTINNQRGLCSNDTILNGYVSNSGWANSINSFLCKYTTISAMPIAGEALLANQFTFMNSNKIYPATNKTLPIETGFGILLNVAAYNKDYVWVGWDRFRDRQKLTSLTNIPHTTLSRGDNCYFRCTTDANGNIYSDNYVSNEMTAGYTWYYVGLAYSNSEISICTTGSHFLTLDSNGKLTAVDGKLIASGGSPAWGSITGTLSNQTDLQTALNGKANDSDVVKLTGDQTVDGVKTFNKVIKAKAGFDVINSNVTKGTNPSSTQYWGLFRANDVNHTGAWTSTRLGIGEVSINTVGTTNLMLGVYKNEANSATNATLNVGYNLTTGAYATAPSPSASNATNTNFIATTGWVNNPATSTNVVHRSGDETISGVKTFTQSNAHIVIKTTSANYGEEKYGQGYLQFLTGDNKETGYVNSYLVSATQTKTELVASWLGTNSRAVLRLKQNEDGSKAAELFAPTEDTTSSIQIDTVGARNTKLANYVPTSRKVNNKALSSDITLTASDVSAVASNTAITGATKCKITYDSKGLVTAGADLSSSDVTTALGYTPYNSTNPSGYQANVIETVKVNGTALTPSSKAVNVTVPTESTVSGWGFTKNSGTVTSVNNVSPVNGNVTLSIPAAQVNSDWNANSGVAQILNKPNTSQVHVVIESYHNGYNWYRIYDDGWCEQGGATPYGVNSTTVTLHKEFLDTNYVVTVSLSMLANTSTDTGGRGDAPETSNFTTTSFRVSQPSASNRCTIWEAKGFIS